MRQCKVEIQFSVSDKGNLIQKLEQEAEVGKRAEENGRSHRVLIESTPNKTQAQMYKVRFQEEKNSLGKINHLREKKLKNGLITVTILGQNKNQK